MPEAGPHATPLTAVPFLDLGRVHAPLKEAMLADLAELLDTGAFSNGPPVAAFERAFAEYCEATCCVGVGNGLDALRLGLLAAGIEPGDEVIVPAHTFVATFEAVTQAGGVPVPADVLDTDFNLDPEAAAAAVTPRTRFLLPVHLYGQLADGASLRELARRHNLFLFEDACQAHGAERDGLRAGTVGDAAAFSFYPGKNLGAIGDAGAFVTGDEALAARVVALREHGQSAKYRHVTPGFTSRLDSVQAAALLRKLPLLDTWNDERRRVAALYDEAFSDVDGVQAPPSVSGSSPVWHLYVIRVDDPDGLAARLRERGIGTGRHYPDPPHLSDAYASLGYERGSFPVAERICDEVLSLPMFPGMTEAEVETTVIAVRDCLDG